MKIYCSNHYRFQRFLSLWVIKAGKVSFPGQRVVDIARPVFWWPFNWPWLPLWVAAVLHDKWTRNRKDTAA